VTHRMRGFLSASLLLASAGLTWASPITTQPILPEWTTAAAKARTQLGALTARRAAASNLGAAPAGVFTEHAAAVSATTESESGCGFAGVCYSTIRAPEPQSLFLMGSGLIAMASLIRRRLVR
jgi:PEP-CTERM motif